MLRLYRSAEDLPGRLPIFPLGGALLLPRVQLPLNIFEPRYLDMVDDALKTDRVIGMIQPREDGQVDSRAPADAPELYSVGCVGRITSFTETDDGRVLITLSGVCRFTLVEELDTLTRYRIVKPDYSDFLDDLRPGFGEERVDRESVISALRDYLDAHNLKTDWNEINQASSEVLVNSLSMISPYSWGEKQALLEARDLRSRAEILVALTKMALAGDARWSGKRLQ